MTRKSLELLTVGFLLLFIAGSAYVVLGLAAGVKIHFMVVGFSTVAFFAFAVLHAGLTLGTGHMVVFLLISFSVSLLFELLGTSRGWIYGAYHYTDRLGPKVLDLVPVLIPLAWFMMMYASYTLANVLAPAPRTKKDVGRLVWLVFLSAMIMTAWDLMNDPVNVNGGHWVWENGGPYFGIPISNFIGWMLTTLVIFGLYRWYEVWRPPRRQQSVLSRFWLLPIVGYAVTMLANVGTLVVTGQPAPAMIGLFSMGAFLAAALPEMMSSKRMTSE